MMRFLERQSFQAAFDVACLGVTEQDWRRFAASALKVRRKGRMLCSVVLPVKNLHKYHAHVRLFGRWSDYV